MKPNPRGQRQLSNPADTRAAIAEEWHTSTAADWRSHAADCARLAESYEQDAKLFAHGPFADRGKRGAEMARRLRISERHFLRAAKRADAEEAQAEAERLERERLAHEEWERLEATPERVAAREAAEVWAKARSR